MTGSTLPNHEYDSWVEYFLKRAEMLNLPLRRTYGFIDESGIIDLVSWEATDENETRSLEFKIRLINATIDETVGLMYTLTGDSDLNIVFYIKQGFARIDHIDHAENLPKVRIPYIGGKDYDPKPVIDYLIARFLE